MGAVRSVGEALTVAQKWAGPKELECILGARSCLLSTEHNVILKSTYYLKCYKYILRAQIKAW
jgi:hypothetical protein